MSIFIEGIEFTIDEDRAVCVSFPCFRVEIIGVVINCDKASEDLFAFSVEVEDLAINFLEAGHFLTFVIVIVVIALIVDNTIAISWFTLAVSNYAIVISVIGSISDDKTSCFKVSTSSEVVVLAIDGLPTSKSSSVVTIVACWVEWEAWRTFVVV